MYYLFTYYFTIALYYLFVIRFFSQMHLYLYRNIVNTNPTYLIPIVHYSMKYVATRARIVLVKR